MATCLVEEMHQDHLRIPFTSISRLRSFTRLANLDNDHVGNDVTRAFVQSSIDFAHVVLLRPLAQRLETERLGIEVRIHSEDIQDDGWRSLFVTETLDISVTNDHEKLSFVIVLESDKRVDCSSQRLFSFGVAWDLTDDKLVVILRSSG